MVLNANPTCGIAASGETLATFANHERPHSPCRGFAKQARRGVSLVETVACVMIVVAMATSIIGVMQGSIRVATASRGVVGAPAEARQTLRFLADRFRSFHESEGIVKMDSSSIACASRTYKFDERKSSSGVGTDLFLVDDSGNETLCVSGSLGDFEFEPISLAGIVVGVELRLHLQKVGEESATLRPMDREAKMTTQVCFAPQFTVTP
ncbi:hypothetical protein [Rhodopirellula sp. SWK7]|uniref:hypothetical protein n=1 Tax=Rhodopirellula sp. SWK7 TaxID=595460 RepID=UPI0002BD98DC|nr:hypothetical protein [Rhodopirellula sp. SWK7]EMI44389.1 hypothetical protein RRSWK_03190 [Rhodopirellula sp. SWK7]